MKDYHGEFAADELEKEQYDYNIEGLRNQYPQAAKGEPSDSIWGQEPRQAVPPPGDGNIPDEEYQNYGDPVCESIAEYTMIFDPDSDESIASTSES